MNLKLNLICTLLFCFSFFNGIGQTAKNYSKSGDLKSEKIEEDTKKTEYSSMDLEDNVTSICLKLTNITSNEVNQLIRDFDTQEYKELKNMPHPIDYFLTNCQCNPEDIARTKSPLMHLVIESPCARANFPAIIYKYYAVKRKKPEMFLNIINAKDTQGNTYLDYIYNLYQRSKFNSEDGERCIKELISFACTHGGVYSKYKNECSCDKSYIKE
jgi:hypothetical protein